MAIPHYYTEVDIFEYDRSIGNHSYISQAVARLCSRLVQELAGDKRSHSARILDVGAGSGFVTRFLVGLPDVVVEACDPDPASRDYFRRHPELAAVPFYQLDVVADRLPRRYDAIVASGVMHHLPKSTRAVFLKRLLRFTESLFILDEGVAPYATHEERLAHCNDWIGHVVAEARRRGLDELAREEEMFLEHEAANSADDGGDFKESVDEFLDDVRRAGDFRAVVELVGPWDSYSGGFFLARVAPSCGSQS